MIRTATIRLSLLCLLLSAVTGWVHPAFAGPNNMQRLVRNLSQYDSRNTGSAGAEKAAQFIEGELAELGLEPQSYLYQVPIRKVISSSLTMGNKKYALKPFLYNAITPEATNGPLTAPIYYAGDGSLKELDGLAIENSIVLLDFASGRNWQTVASLGAAAVIYIGDKQQQSRFFFDEKKELTPIQFPCYWMPREDAMAFFDDPLSRSARVSTTATLATDIRWKNSLARNIYAFIPGTDPKLKGELLILEAFYDSEEMVAGDSPGADAALSIATLLDTARQFTSSPPARSVLLLATSGNNQTLAGMRDMIWSINSRSKELRGEKKRLGAAIREKEKILDMLQGLTFPLKENEARDKLLKQAISQTLSLRIDTVSRQVMQLRLEEKNTTNSKQIKQLASERLGYKQLSWTSHFHALPRAQVELLHNFLPDVILQYQNDSAALSIQSRAFASATSFRSQVRDYDIGAVISLYLSGHGSGIGGFHRGWLYPLKPSINRTGIYSTLADILEETGKNQTGRAQYKDTLRPSHLRNWDSWFLDRPALGGEVSSMAGLLGLSLVTTDDSRAMWGTPDDTMDGIDWDYVDDQTVLTQNMLTAIGNAPRLHNNKLPRNGFAALTGRSNLLLQGELFATFPARDTTILAYQGLNKYYAMVDSEGLFRIKGFADKKNVLDKLIIEGYHFDKNGQVDWAIDKKDTGKANYRLKILRKSMKTDLTMFTCQQTTIFDLLEPRNFNYMTKIQLFDGRRDSQPRHFWYSRIDTRTSTICSIFTEPGTPLKMTFSDTVITTKMILTNSSKDKKGGIGYNTSLYPILPYTTLHAAQDAWSLLGPRIDNLESHGIFDPRIDDLKNRGLTALKTAQQGRAELNYSVAKEAAGKSLALSARVYTEVQKTQKDVLFGVLFYIALFVPFAFVMERFLFNYVNIYQRIVAFSGILALLIAVIYNVHPAFNLAYSPLIIILAFFIIALSLVVTLIIFFRFEAEMTRLQSRANHLTTEEISHWKAFTAAFFLGVSNLRRRRLRTLLTCSTLIILTFTIMSFTTIKSSQKHMRLPFQSTAPYQGILLKRLDWQSLPTQATDILMGSMQNTSTAAPRVWMEESSPTKPVHIPLEKNGVSIDANGLIGLSPNEAEVTGLPNLLASGRWFTKDDKLALIIEEQMARQLGIYGQTNPTVNVWGAPFTVIGTFKAERFEEALDLDGEPLTPVIFPDEQNSEISEAEQDALESGENIQSFQSRYRHIPFLQTIIMPAETLLAAGGKLKNVALKPDVNPEEVTKSLDELASSLVDRFNLAIFTGDKDGVWLYNSSDTISYSGVPNIIIPLLISIFIVLNTMISSVHERKGEIAVYTSVGLAPTHVAFLFIAEALALAVISVVIGYLVAQISASLLSSTPLWEGITVNYSSLAGVAAMFLVIGVVLISVIYPAKMAANIAIPDVNRTFTLPAPKNNAISITLPFLLKKSEFRSLGGFLYSYFSAHKEVSHGLFSTDNVNLETLHATQDNSAIARLTSQVWLAPFDLGIMQDIAIEFTPEETIGTDAHPFLEVQMTIHRQAGEAGLWKRINTAFIHELRKQLLLWRSIDQEGHIENKNIFTHKATQHTEEIV